MEITTFSDSPSAEYAGKRYWFCCEHCRERFVEEPSAFVDSKQ
jgi:YHS domain-containing protein